MQVKKTVLLIELKFHQEVLPSQLQFLLDAGYEVHLFLFDRLWDDDLFGEFKDKIKLTLLPNPKKIINKFKILFQINSYIKKHQISTVVFNTLDSNFNKFFYFLSPKVYTVGIIHKVHLFRRGEKYFNLFKKVDAPLVLSDYAHQYLIAHCMVDHTKPSSCFYPIFFSRPKKQKKQLFHSQINICIPGQLDLRRRDYLKLIDTLADQQTKMENICFLLLGNCTKIDGPEVMSYIKEKGVEKYFRTYNSFVSYHDFFEQIEDADYIMPLLYMGDNAVPYKSSQISASFNWAYGFNTRLLIHENFVDNVITPAICSTYTNDNLNLVLSSLQKLPKLDIAKETQGYLTFEQQAANYLKVFV